MAHEREAAGAANGMREVYGPIGVGLWASGVTDGRRWSGEIVEVEPGLVRVRIDEHTVLAVKPSEIDQW